VAKEDVDSIGELRNHLSQSLPAYMVPSYFTFLDKMPLTANGKIDQKALPEPEARAAGVYAAPRDDIEKKMVAIWSEVLGIEEEKIGIDDNFFELGGHSLKATIIRARIHKCFNSKVALKELFKTTTIRALTVYIKGSRKERYEAIRPLEKKDYYALSSAQKRLYVTQQMDTDSTNYNVYTVLQAEGKLDRARMEQAVWAAIERHESLRTSFEIIEVDPIQRVHNSRDIRFEIEDYKIGSREQGIGNRVEVTGIINRFIRPFDLKQAPLLRVGLIALADKTHILMVDMHHIISDGTSLDLFSRELTALYAGKEPALSSIQYRDYSQWQNSAGEKEKIAKQEEYWLKQFSEKVPVLELPYDFPRPQIKSYEGKVLFFEMNEEETAALNRLALDRETTLYTVLLTIYYVFLAKMSGREDIVIGAATAGRLHADLAPVIGMFVNTLPLRNYPEGGKSFREFLQEVKTRTLEAFDNQDYQLEELINKLGVQRDASRSPLFDVIFALQNLTITEIEVRELELLPCEHENKTSKSDLIFIGSEAENKLFISLEYSTKLFEKGTIERFVGYFKDITAAVLENVDVELQTIDIFSRLKDPESAALQEVGGDFGF
jgi:tyrocidine synthetase-3